MTEVAIPRETRARAVPVTRRITGEPAFVLHSYAYKESSLIIDLLTRAHGRVALVARGAKRPRSELRGILLAFRPLSVDWIVPRNRASELGTLAKAEWVGGVPALSGSGLLCGFYLNELLMKLLARHDAHEALFDAYLHAVAGLAQGGREAPILRAFEYMLLREAGYAMQLTHCSESGEAVRVDGFYRYEPERGPVRVADAPLHDDLMVFGGKCLLDMEREDYSDPQTLAQSKVLTRQLLNYHLGGQTLQTRQIMLELQDL